MDSYLSAIDNYIQEGDKIQQQKQQQLFYLGQEQLAQQHEPTPSSWSTSIATNPYMQSVMTMPQQCVYTSNMTNYQQQASTSPSQPPFSTQSTHDPHEAPIKIRKKPGRRPNPASLANRKEQNRAAQRAFRERKERRLHDAEVNIQALKEQHHSTTKELKKTKHQLKQSQTENWYLKGVILTLQFMCMHHNIGISPHSPYLSQETLAQMAKTHPHSVESYIRTCTHLKQDFTTDHPSSPDISTPSSHSVSTSLLDEETEPTMTMKNEDTMEHHKDQSPTTPSTEPTGREEETEDDTDDSNQATMSKTCAIQHIRIQSTLAPIYNTYQPSERLQPTPLQQAIPHDSRIDLIPCPLMRDRMIIFRDHMDYDQCFNAILDGAVYHGGDPTLSQNWQLPPSFYREYWFLSSKYGDIGSAKNRRTQMNHLPLAFPLPHDQTTTVTTPTTLSWLDDHSHYSSLASSQQQQQQFPLYDTSSESPPVMSHLGI